MLGLLHRFSLTNQKAMENVLNEHFEYGVFRDDKDEVIAKLCKKRYRERDQFTFAALVLFFLYYAFEGGLVLSAGIILILFNIFNAVQYESLFQNFAAPHVSKPSSGTPRWWRDNDDFRPGNLFFNFGILGCFIFYWLFFV